MIDKLLIGLMRIMTGAVVRGHPLPDPAAGPCIYYANHTSHIDALMVWALVPSAYRKRVHPAAAKDYWWKTAAHRYLAENVFNAVPVIRQRENVHCDPLIELENVLAKGDSLIFFPEGTRGHGGEIQPFKSGLYHLVAKHPAVTLVPIYIENLNRVLPKGEFLPVPISCTVTFGEAFRLQSGEAKPDFLARAHANLEALAS